MVIDIKLTEDLDTTWNEVGDLSTVGGVEYVRQTVVVTLLEDVDLTAPSLTPDGIESQRGAIETAVRQIPNTQEPIEVVVDGSSIDNQSVTYSIRTNRVELPIEVTPP